MSFNLTAFVKKIPIPFLYGATGWLATEIPVVLQYVPATIMIGGTDYSLTALISTLSFVGGALYWIHNELKAFVQTPTTATAAALVPSASAPAPTPSPTPPPFPAVPSNYGTVVAGPTQVTAQNATTAPGASNPDAPVGSWVEKTSNGWYAVLTPGSTALVFTKIAPIQGM